MALPTLQRGATGQDVKRAQALVLSTGRAVAIDGEYGPKTQAAVVAFQRSGRLVADGITGRQTWAALLGEKL